MKVRIAEMFTSLEGEGALYGTKTLFVRLAGCPFGCFYCDTQEALPADSGTEYDVQEACKMMASALQPRTFKVNFTGGDPLMQHEAVAEMAGFAQSLGAKTYLESSCFDPKRFSALLPVMDLVKVEFKTLDSGFVPPDKHPEMVQNALECLQAAASAGKRPYVKIVVSSKTRPADLGSMLEKIFSSGAAGSVSGLFLQPVYGDGAPDLGLLLSLHDEAVPYYGGVRVVPQLHKLIGAP